MTEEEVKDKPAEKPPEVDTPKEVDIATKVGEAVAEKLAAKDKELGEFEARVDKKLQEMRELSTYLKDQGKSLAGDAVGAGQTEAQKKEEEAKKAANRLSGGLLE